MSYLAKMSAKLFVVLVVLGLTLGIPLRNASAALVDNLQFYNLSFQLNGTNDTDVTEGEVYNTTPGYSASIYELVGTAKALQDLHSVVLMLRGHSNYQSGE